MGSKPREGPVESLEEGLAGLVGRLESIYPRSRMKGIPIITFPLR